MGRAAAVALVANSGAAALATITAALATVTDAYVE
jgi:hypothetical protein